MLELEHENILAGMDWFAGQQNHPQGMRKGCVQISFWNSCLLLMITWTPRLLE